MFVKNFLIPILFVGILLGSEAVVISSAGGLIKGVFVSLLIL